VYRVARRKREADSHSRPLEGCVGEKDSDNRKERKTQIRPLGRERRTQIVDGEADLDLTLLLEREGLR